MPTTLAEASRLIAAKELSPVELTSSCLNRIEADNEKIAAFITLTADSAMDAARRAESRIMKDGPRTPLDGIPIAHKDIFNTAGIRTTAHSRLLEHNVPTEDATVVRLLAEAGTTMLGKLSTLEFALAGPSFDLPWPPARNPWNTDHFTAGSSSGTAAAIASGMILGGTGSDTGGSIRGPAAMCGTSGIKPTYGRCSRVGMIPLAPSLDQAGPMAPTAEDSALMLQQMAGHDPSDPVSVDLPVPDFLGLIGKSVRDLRIGVVRHFHEQDLPATSSVLSAIERSLNVLRAAGAEVSDVALSPLLDYSAANKIIMNCEAAAVHEADMNNKPQLYGALLRGRLIVASMLSSNDYLQAQRRRKELSHELATMMKTVDVLITATAVSEAPRMDEVTTWDGLVSPSFTAPWNLTGLPAIAVRMGNGENNLPISVQLGGRAFDEARLFQVAHLLESEAF